MEEKVVNCVVSVDVPAHRVLGLLDLLDEAGSLARGVRVSRPDIKRGVRRITVHCNVSDVNNLKNMLSRWLQN